MTRPFAKVTTRAPSSSSVSATSPGTSRSWIAPTSRTAAHTCSTGTAIEISLWIVAMVFAGWLFCLLSRSRLAWQQRQQVCAGPERLGIRILRIFGLNGSFLVAREHLISTSPDDLLCERPQAASCASALLVCPSQSSSSLVASGAVGAEERSVKSVKSVKSVSLCSSGPPSTPTMPPQFDLFGERDPGEAHVELPSGFRYQREIITP